MADQAKPTGKPEKAEKPEKPPEPSVARKITCTKCGAVKGASRDRYLKLMMKQAGLEYKDDEQAIKALGGIGSAKYNAVEKQVKESYLCRDCRPKKPKVDKSAVKDAKGE